MMRWKTTSLALALVVAAAGLAAQSGGGGQPGPHGAQAQPRSSGLAEFPFKWWQEPRFKAELALSDDQVAQINAIFEAAVPGLRTCYRNLERVENRLNDVISSGEVTEADLIKQIDLVEASRSEMSKTRTLMLFRMRQVLTPEQRAKMKTMHEEWERERRKPPR